MGPNRRILDLEDPIRSLPLPLCTYSAGYPSQKKPFSDRDAAALQMTTNIMPPIHLYIDSLHDREPQRMLPADGFMSASRDGPCSRYAGSRRGMRHTAQTDDIQRRTNDRTSSSITAHEAVQTRMPSKPYHTALCANSQSKSPFGSIPIIRVYPGLIWVHPSHSGLWARAV
ncbi:hypothetical protein CDL15_Pgr023283 [Punica granatum]|uniref:Uncharacterized protein n=1 Tax=Punica granatum TaxID=22663 RepID=A0A218WK35_PUNGR|nr:hypothetical protein CDL15_Pgr023283 [Punica granatum]